jgi:YfiH family protein
MEWKSSNGIKWVQFESLTRSNITHGLFTRHGGVSPTPWASLNLGGTVGDDASNTVENKKRILNVFNLAFDSVYDAWQVHSADYIRAYEPRPLDVKQLKADILVTNVPGLPLMMRFADCVPLMAYDPVNQAIGIAHAGWIGTTKDVAGCMVRAMNREFGSKPENLITGIGPSIGQDHYPVGEEVVTAVERVLGSMKEDVIQRINGNTHLDLWKTNEILLRKTGVKNVEVAGICTVCHNEDWFSHRGEKGKTGRFGAIIQIPR